MVGSIHRDSTHCRHATRHSNGSKTNFAIDSIGVPSLLVPLLLPQLVPLVVPEMMPLLVPQMVPDLLVPQLLPDLLVPQLVPLLVVPT